MEIKLHLGAESEGEVTSWRQGMWSCGGSQGHTVDRKAEGWEGWVGDPRCSHGGPNNLPSRTLYVLPPVSTGFARRALLCTFSGTAGGGRGMLLTSPSFHRGESRGTESSGGTRPLPHSQDGPRWVRAQEPIPVPRGPGLVEQLGRVAEGIWLPREGQVTFPPQGPILSTVRLGRLCRRQPDW